MNRFATRLLFALACSALALVLPESAYAQRPLEISQADTVRAEVMVISATNGGEGVGPSLRRLEGNLLRQFGQFDSFRLDSRHTLVLAVGETRSLRLPGGGSASIRIEADGDGTATMVVSVPGGTSRIESGGLVFVGAGSAGGGGVILAIQS